MSERACKDCLAETIVPADGHARITKLRPAPHPGPRCVTHHRAVVKARRLAAQEKRVLQVYGIPAHEYDRIYALQGGRCYVCRRATGARKRLAVDHDHACCDGPTSCGNCVRGLLCSTCNKIMGHLRDEPHAFLRGARYLWDWPSGNRHYVHAPEDSWIQLTVGSFLALAGFDSSKESRSAGTASVPAPTPLPTRTVAARSAA